MSDVDTLAATVREARDLADVLRHGKPGWLLFAEKMPPKIDALCDGVDALVEHARTLEANLRVREASQIPVIPSGAQRLMDALRERIATLERERDEARLDRNEARDVCFVLRARADRYEKALREQAEPIMDERFRDRLLRHGLSNDEVAALVDAIYQRQQKALNALAGEDA